MQMKALVLLTIFKRFDEDIPVGLPAENVYPADYSERKVINCLLVVNDIALSCQ